MLALVLAVALGVVPDDVLEIRADTTLDPARTYGPIVIRASGITLDGRGAKIVGATGGDPKTFRGVGIAAEGVSDITIKNVRVRGFETGIHIRDSRGATVEDCDVSDNFHDPEFDWGENGRRGGILLEGVELATLARNRASRVWDACTLVDCRRNTLVDNDFSRTSNTGLKLWRASHNIVLRNNFSYGLRIRPGEVHARDSTGVLIESGSDHNFFADNDATHGGDGIFIRVLNGWVSTGNVFLRNDVSYANNNGFEAWSPGNRYIENTANHCSYGFWLGASDKTELVGNDASYNGDPKGFHNSPHLPENGHAGIVFMFGPSSHTTVRDNRCVGNNGAGIALIGDLPRFRAYHWIVEGNTLESNRWGVYGHHADWILLRRNHFDGNTIGDLSLDSTVTNRTEPPATGPADRLPPVARLEAPDVARVGQSVPIRSRSTAADGGPARSAIGLGDGVVHDTDRLDPVFGRAGFHRLGLTCDDGRAAALDWRDLYVIDDLAEIDAEADAWSCPDGDSKVRFAVDRRTRLVGDRSIRAEIDPYGGGRVRLALAHRGFEALANGESLVFWMRTRNSNIPGWQGPNPVVTLAGPTGRAVFTPKVDRLQQPADNEAREGWTRFEISLAGDPNWEREGSVPGEVGAIEFGLDSWGAGPIACWIDGLAVRPREGPGRP